MAKEPKYQYILWRRWRPYFGLIRGNPLKHPIAFHLIYKWSLWLGWFEIRKFYTLAESTEAMLVYLEANEITV